MTKNLFIGIMVLTTFASLTCCKMFGHRKKGNEMEINYSGEKLAVSDIQGEELFQLLQADLVSCSDIYELIVTNKVIDDIKKEEEYLEIRLDKHLETVLNTGKKVVFNEMLIPLSGQYAPEDQMTFFLSDDKVHHTPCLNTNGLQELKKRLQNLK